MTPRESRALLQASSPPQPCAASRLSLGTRHGVCRKRLIFTLTTGRSGTAYLARLMRCVKYATVGHEPTPAFQAVMRQVQTQPELATRFWVEEKLPGIAQQPGRLYVETSHVFCKGFAEPLLELGVVPDLISLRRSHRAVASSMYRLGTIPGRSELALRYYLSPTDPNVLQLGQWEQLQDYQLCYWYCLEIERRQKQDEKMFSESGARILKLTFSELLLPRGFLKVMWFAGVRFPSARCWWWRHRISRKPINAQNKNKRDVDLPDNLDELEAEVEATVNSS